MNNVDKINLVTAYKNMFKNYANFSGRTGRREFWYATIFNLIVMVAGALILILPGLILGIDNNAGAFGVAIMPFLEIIYSLAVLVPCLAIEVRRLHDTGKSGWFVILTVIPYIGALVLFVFFLLEGQAGENKYGPDPRGN